MPTIIDGTTGASQIQDGTVTVNKIADGAVTAAKLAAGVISTTSVLAATAGASVGAVGTYAILGRTSIGQTVAGSTYAGSGLQYFVLRSADSFVSNSPTAMGVYGGNGGTPSGTWRAMGGTSAAVQHQATLFLRIS